MKTALSRFIEYLEGIKERDNIPSHVITTAQNYLEPEKQNIINAVTYGNRMDFYDASETAGEQYYETTFKN